jgi:DNA-binding NtrC family response regulator
MANHNPSALNQSDRSVALVSPHPSLAWADITPSMREPSLVRIAPADVAPGVPSASEAEVEPLRMARRNATSAFELAYLKALLPRSEGSIARAAAMSKVSRQMLQKLMRKHGLKMPR